MPTPQLVSSSLPPNLIILRDEQSGHGIPGVYNSVFIGTCSRALGLETLGQTMLWRTGEGTGLTQPRGKSQGPQCGLGHRRTPPSFLYVVKPKPNQPTSPHSPLLPFPQPHSQIPGRKSDEQQALLMTGYRSHGLFTQ